MNGLKFRNTSKASLLHIAGSAENDLLELAHENQLPHTRWHSAEEALAGARKGDAILVLADNYPEKKTVVPAGFYARAKQKSLGIFIEFPDQIPSGMTGSIINTDKERIIVASDFFGAALPVMSLMDAGLFSAVRVPERPSHLTGAKVAGFDTAVYGLSETPSFPILFEDDGVLVCTTKLSDFNKSRYAPREHCEVILRSLLRHFHIVDGKTKLLWTALVRPSYARHDMLPTNAYQTAVDRGVEWYMKGRFLIHPEWKEHWYNVGVTHSENPVGPPMNLSLPSGDGSLGVMEGHYSYINADGSQPYRYWLRADCVAETAMTFAMANLIQRDEKKKAIAENLMNFLFETDAFKTVSSKDPLKSSYGLIGWANTHTGSYYGDDNARVLLGATLASQALGDDRWNDHILKLILGNFRTTGSTGFRGPRLESDDVDSQTWTELMNGTIVNAHPHFESWLWANYLWLYAKTQYQPLLDLAKKAITTTMEHYPDNWKWTNGIQQERARMILPLAWLVRVEDTKEHRQWLHNVVNELLKSQVSCGAIREEVGSAGGQFGPTRSNDSYGSTEAPVIHKNGDAVADMLYTSNFALFTLNEAAHASKNLNYAKAVRVLSDFLVRIQSTSDGRADLDGCWFRAFDFNNWEYYGSNADHGWGAWGTLTGWTQSFITTTLAMIARNTSFWDLTETSQVGNHIDSVWKEMLSKPES